MNLMNVFLMIQFHWERIDQNIYRFQKSGQTSNVSNRVFFQNSNNTLILRVAADTAFVYNRIK